ncbi:MAG: Hsp20/alpha crystallin family protein [Chloroflexota bacterium]
MQQHRRALPGRWLGVTQYQTWHPPTDLYEAEEQYVVRVEVAGMGDGDFRISLSDRMLVVGGFRQDSCAKQVCHQIEVAYGEFRSEVLLPGAVDQDKIEATYADGFLMVVLPKKQAQRVPVVRI